MTKSRVATGTKPVTEARARKSASGEKRVAPKVSARTTTARPSRKSSATALHFWATGWDRMACGREATPALNSTREPEAVTCANCLRSSALNAALTTTKPVPTAKAPGVNKPDGAVWTERTVCQHLFARSLGIHVPDVEEAPQGPGTVTLRRDGQGVQHGCLRSPGLRFVEHVPCDANGAELLGCKARPRDAQGGWERDNREIFDFLATTPPTRLSATELDHALQDAGRFALLRFEQLDLESELKERQEQLADLMAMIGKFQCALGERRAAAFEAEGDFHTACRTLIEGGFAHLFFEVPVNGWVCLADAWDTATLDRGHGYGPDFEAVKRSVENRKAAGKFNLAQK